jgi:hypothetical protein
MSLNRWHNGHSLATGAAFGLMLSYRPWLVFALGVVCGVLVVGGYRFARTLHAGFEAWTRTQRARTAKIRTEPTPVYSTRRRSRQSSELPF